MENKIKRFLSLLLAFVMVLGMFPAGHAHVHAEEVSKTEMAIVDATPDAPEAGKQYVIAVKRSNGAYWAMTSESANFQNHGCLALKNTTVAEAAPVDAEAVWTVVNTEGGFKLRHSNGKELSLESTVDKDAFLRDVGEVVTFPVANTEENTYHIKTGFNRYINALGGQDGATSVGNFGQDPAPLHFFEVKTTINMEMGETYSITLPGYYSNVTGTDVVTAEAAVELGTVVRPVSISGTAFSENEIESGAKFVVMSNRNGKYLTDRYVEASAKTGLELVDKVEDASVWTFTKVGDNYAISAENGNIFIGSTDNKVTLSKTDVVTVRKGSGDDVWEICRPDTNRCLNEFDSFAVSSGNEYAASAYTGAGDAGSQWKLFLVEESKDVSYREVTKQFVTGGQYIFQNTRKSTAMTNVATGNALTLKNMSTITPDMVWTVIAQENGYQVKDQSGMYLTIDHSNNKNIAKTVDTPTTIFFEKHYQVDNQSYNWRFTWAIYEGDAAGDAVLNDVNGTAAGWHGGPDLNRAKRDQGSQWRSYMPVANTTISFEAVAVGDTTITIGDTTYTFHVTPPTGDHEHTWSDATCKDPAKCACGETTGEVDPNNHVRITTTGAVKPTLCETGRTGTTACEACGVTIVTDTEISQLPVATVLNGNKLVALNECEYTLEGAENGNYSLSHGAYYVNPAANGTANIPQSTNKYTKLYLHWQDPELTENAVHINGNGGLHFWDNQGSNNKNKNYWDRCEGNFINGNDNPNDRAHDLYLFRAKDTVAADDLIPGYTKVTAKDVKAGESYLIAGICEDKWYVMHPVSATTATVKLEHVAEVKSELHTPEHTPVPMEDVAPTFENTGRTGGTECSVCGEVVTDPTVVPAGYNTDVVDSDHIIPDDGSHQNNNPNEGPASYALDDDFNTMWHTAHASVTDLKDRWISFELTQEYELTGLYYKPRTGARNGTITKYKIEVSYDGVTYVEFMSGDWNEDDTWKKVFFEKPIQVKKVKLIGVETVGGFGSAVEIRLVGTRTDHEHTFSAVVTPPTCLNKGYTTYTCSVEDCGASYVADYVDALCHAFDDLCDTECNNNCGEEGGTRPPEHIYTNVFDTTCDRCKAVREDAKASTVGDKIVGLTGEPSSVEDGEDADVDNAFDGQPNTYWATDATNRKDTVVDQYLITDLHGEYLINKVAYTKRVNGTSYECTGNLLDYIIEVRVGEDGEWKQVKTGTTNDGTTEITFDPVVATHVRLRANQSYHWQDGQPGESDYRNSVMTVAEFEVFKAECVEHTEGDSVENVVNAVCKEKIVYCADCGAEVYRTPVWTNVVVQSMNVLLDSEIKMQYTVSVPEEMLTEENDITIVLTKEGGYGTEIEEFNVNWEMVHWTDEKGDFIEVATGIASGEMTCPVKIEVLVNGTAVELYTKDGTSLGESASRSVVDYALKALKDEEDADRVNLIKAMLVYGSYAQLNFNVNTDKLAYAEAKLGALPGVEQVTANTVAAYVNEQTNPNMGVTASSVTAFVDSDIYLRVYLNVEGNIEDYQFSIDPSYDEETKRYYVDLTGIASALIDETYSITVTNAGGETNTITTSMLSYVRSVLNNGNNSQTKKDLVKAMYLYNQSANVYFNR